MATFQISADAHDGMSEGTNESITPAESGLAGCFIGGDGATTYDGGWIFRSTAIPALSTILTCTITLIRGADFSGTVDGAWFGFNVDNPTNFNAADVHRISDHNSRTTATVADDFATSQTTHVSPSLVAIAQEIVNRAGFSGDIGFTWRAASATGSWWEFLDFNEGAGNSGLLTITWTPPIVTVQAPEIFLYDGAV